MLYKSVEINNIDSLRSVHMYKYYTQATSMDSLSRVSARADFSWMLRDTCREVKTGQNLYRFHGLQQGKDNVMALILIVG